MTDKTQLEAIDDILKKYARDVFPTKESNLPVDRRLVAQQILDLCQPKWIDINERLPKRYEPVQIFTSYGKQVTAYLDEESKPTYGWVDWMRPSMHTYGSVTHWMPLPEPPGESE